LVSAAEAFALVCALALCAPPAALADTAPPAALKTGRVVGVVTAAGKAASVHVFVTGKRLGTMTDLKGRFRIDDAPAGSQQVIILGDAVESQQVPVVVSIGPDHPTFVRIDCPALDCSYAGKGSTGGGCLRFTSEERGRIGQRCSAHPRERLRADTVSVDHADFFLLPGQREGERDSFPNARLFIRDDEEDRTKYAQVAYCPACRRAYARWYSRVRYVR